MGRATELNERRGRERLPLRLGFRVRESKSRLIYYATSRNIHTMGVQFETDAPVEPGMAVEVWPVEAQSGDYFVHAVVIWKEPQPERKSRCGLLFERKVNWHIPLADLSKSFRTILTRGGEIPSDFVLDSIADGVFSVDHEWRITSFNRAAEQLTGWTRERALGKVCKEVFQSSSCGKECVLAESIREGEPVANRSVFITHASGRRIATTISAAPLLNKQGRIVGGVQIFRDVKALIDRALILDNIGEGVFTVDTQWRITSFNKTAEKITGFSAAEAIGRPCSEIFHASICGETCAIAHSMCTGKPESNRCIQIRNVQGQQVPVSICAAPLYDPEGNLVGGVESFRDLRMVTALKRQLFRRNILGDIVSKSPAMKRIFDIIPHIAQSDSTVLVLGESGTGKELVAKALHEMSPRRKGPFVAMNCGALPDTLLESELFGYKAGAFTDAKKDRQGRFAAAAGGTLFLDEIGDISPALQIKLLRVLETKTYEPLGSSTPVSVDVRVIAATNRDLEQMVREGTFRDDLYYRLNVVQVVLPPLRERIEDVPLLVDHFIDKMNLEKGKDIAGLSEEAMRLLMSYDFPGNVRELQNILEYAFILCPGGLIQPEHLPSPFAPERGEASPPGLPGLTEPLSLAEIEKRAIYTALERNRWKRMATCRELGISKDTLRRKIAQYRIEPPEEGSAH